MNSIRIDTGQVKRDIEKYFKENNIICFLDNWQFTYDEDNNLLYHPKDDDEEMYLANFIDFIGSIDYLREISDMAHKIEKQTNNH